MQKRAIYELINTADPGWPLIQQWVAKAKNDVEMLPGQREQGIKLLLYLQITTRSPMGAIALESGGILIDHGWLRFLGSGHERIAGNLMTWNSEDNPHNYHFMRGKLVVAYDVMGGFFALNGGAFLGKLGTAFYLSPDTLQWENTHKSYSELLLWALSGELDTFYKNMRWPGWENEIATLNGDHGISIIPFLFTEKGIPVAQRSRGKVPILEMWNLHNDLAKQLSHLPTGTPIQFIIVEDSEKDK